MRFSPLGEEGGEGVNSSSASPVNSLDLQGECVIYLPHFCHEVKIELCFYRHISINLENVPCCFAKRIVE